MGSESDLVESEGASEIVTAGFQPSRKFGDQARQIADRLRAETELQVRLTARILGAAAQIADNHDRLIDEVVEMVEEELDQREEQAPTTPVTEQQLKQRFKTLKAAKAHFGIKAASWAILAEKVNQSRISSSSLQPTPSEVTNQTPDRLLMLEQEVKALHTKVDRLIALVVELSTAARLGS
ncbi:MAG: hypothetical protein VKJ85_08835 [Prochlorothrix sp.]|nr:hypothetical protein [Prochlorothrix sp.]